MSEIKIPFTEKLIDPNQSPSIRIVENNGKCHMLIKIGIKAESILNGTEINTETSRLADADRNIFSFGKIAVGLHRISSVEASSKLAITLDANLITKLPHTGAVFAVFSADSVNAQD